MILKIQPGAYLWSSETMYTHSGFVLSLSAVEHRPRGDFFERVGGVGRGQGIISKWKKISILNITFVICLMLT